MENLRVPTTFKLDWSRYYYTHTNALLSPENIKDFHGHLPDAPHLEKVMSTFQIIQTRSLLSLPRTGRVAELRPKPTYFSGNDSRFTPNTFAEH